MKKDLPVLRLRGTIVVSGPPLEAGYDLEREISDNELGHCYRMRAPGSCANPSRATYSLRPGAAASGL